MSNKSIDDMSPLINNISCNELLTRLLSGIYSGQLQQGYQITQQRQPLGVGGEVEYILIDDNNRYVLKTARITQLQLEQDSGRSVHDEEAGQSLIDLNRAGKTIYQ